MDDLMRADLDAIRTLDGDLGAAFQEQSRLEQTRDRVEYAVELVRVRERADRAVDEQVAVVARLWEVFAQPHRPRYAQLGEPAANGGEREREHLHGQAAARAQARHALLG